MVFLALISIVSPCLGVPDTLEMTDGSKLEKVTDAVMEAGKVKVTHAGGIGRIAPEKFTAESRKALGLAGGENQPAPVPEITRLETTKGEVYEGIRSLRVKPSFISFVYKDGSASVRFEKLSEKMRADFSYNKEIADEFDKERDDAEKAMAKIELAMEKAKLRAEAKVALRKRREQAFWELQFTSFGTNYWLSGPRMRDLSDGISLRALREGGFSAEESVYYLNQAKYR